MTKFARTIPKLTFLVLLLATLAAPTYATIVYTSCSSGCSATNGTYSSWQSAPGSSGLSFSTLPNTFAPGNLSGGVYTDPTGTVFTGYNGVNIDTLMSISGSSLLQSVGGTGDGIEIILPANTYAIAFSITTLVGFGSPMVELGDHNLSNSNYQIVIPSPGGASNTQFFAITSTTPLTELFIGSLGSGGRLQINNFELGEESPTPELSSVSLMGSGLLLLGLLRRRIHKPNSAIA